MPIGIQHLTPLLIAGLWILLGSEALARDITGRVVGVADGDTLTILDSSQGLTKIRLHQIDAPEKKQDFGQRSKQSLSDLTYGKQVRVEVFNTDKYGRTVGKILVNGQDVNLEQVKRGMAWVYVKYASEPAYFAAERTAKAGRVGLWNQPNPIPPWEFRHPDRVKAPAKSPALARKSSGHCGEKRFCKEMTDCAEARYFLSICGVKQLDGDGDGWPCEALCK
jgi:endonuclease YncB( thermonuclease family)